MILLTSINTCIKKLENNKKFGIEIKIFVGMSKIEKFLTIFEFLFKLNVSHRLIFKS